MKYSRLLFSFFAFTICIAQVVQTGEAPQQNPCSGKSFQKMLTCDEAAIQAVMTENVTDDLARIILGKWEVAKNERRLSGYIVFNENGSYELMEELSDGTKVTRTGEFALTVDKSPATIDLCLGRCDQEGSEWTTLFGIIRSIPGEKLEIFTSADGNYPEGFPDDKSATGTMVLSRLD